MSYIAAFVWRSAALHSLGTDFAFSVASFASRDAGFRLAFVADASRSHRRYCRFGNESGAFTAFAFGVAPFASGCGTFAFFSRGAARERGAVVPGNCSTTSYLGMQSASVNTSASVVNRCAS